MSTHSSFDACAIIDVSGADVTNRGRRARFVLPFEAVEHVPTHDRLRVVRPARWRHTARAILADAHPLPTSLRTLRGADVALLPFQLEPALSLVMGVGTRILIADAVGMGKTIQAGLAIAETLARTHDGRALVVCPAGLREQWRHELVSRFRLDAAEIDAAAAASAGLSVNPWMTHAVGIVSIDYVKRAEVMRGVEEMVWDVVVFDEAHALGGRSDRAIAAAALAARSRAVIMLTATPHAGDDRAFARICDLGRLPDDPPLLLFRRARADAGLDRTRRVRWLSIAPSPAEQRMHAALAAYARAVWRAPTPASTGARLAMIVLLRRACSSASVLAASVERRLELLSGDGQPLGTQLALPLSTLDADDDEPAAELSAPGLEDPHEERRHLVRLLTLARDAAARETKLCALRRLLTRSGEPAIVFTEYRDTLRRITAELGIPYVALHGGLTFAERRQVVHRFSSGAERLLLATDAASEGLNLHERCRLVINLELPWTPLRLEQRVGRVDRLGQTRPVHAVHLVARGTSEETVVRRLVEREWRARASLDRIAHVDASAIAATALGDEPLPPHADPAATGPVIPELRETARAEAERIGIARAVGARDVAAPAGAPVITAMRRSNGTCRAYWAWTCSVNSHDEEWLWHTIVGIQGVVAAGAHRTPREIREWLRACADDADAASDPGHAALLARFHQAMRPTLMRAAARERVIAETIQRQRASMARRLVQRGLFESREERQAAARSSTLDAALARCDARLRALARLEQAVQGSRQLAFAILIA